MTAEIAILNKSGVALAADSAVTVRTGLEGNQKIYNTANKIFNLSQHHPVAVMIYNSASLAGIPWETLIKLYRSRLGDKSFDQIKQYKDDFIQFLVSNLNYFDQKVQERSIEGMAFSILDQLLEDSWKSIKISYSEMDWRKMDSKSQASKLVDYFKQGIIQELDRIRGLDKLASIGNLKMTEFVKRNKSKLQAAIKYFSDATMKLSANTKGQLLTLISDSFFKATFPEDWSGMVFVGFGEKQIYPAVASLKFGAISCDRFRYGEESTLEIDQDLDSVIIPFAQRDMIDTFMTGVHPDLHALLRESIKTAFLVYNDAILDTLGIKVAKDKDRMKKSLEKVVNKTTEQLENEFTKIRQVKYVNRITQTVSAFSKEEMAELAESLIFLTYLKHRTQSDTETVGGPIDVAVVTKGDGFIWLKRKHYFEPELNLNYLSKIFTNP